MKKILAVVIVAVMAMALCLGAAAVDPHTSADQIMAGSDEHDLASFGNNPVDGTDLGDITEEFFYAWGWYANEQKIVEFGYRYGDKVVLGSEKFIGGDADTIAAQAAGLGMTDGESVRFKIAIPVVKGDDVEVKAVVKLADGTIADFWTIFYSAAEGKTVDELGGTAVDPKANDPAPTTGNDDTNPTTADASVIAIAAVACVALAGVVVAKKVR